MPGSFFIKFAWSDDEMVAGGNKVMEKLGKSLLVARTRLRKLTHQRESSTKKTWHFILPGTIASPLYSVAPFVILVDTESYQIKIIKRSRGVQPGKSNTEKRLGARNLSSFHSPPRTT